MRILVIEDAPRMRQGLVKALHRAGYAVDAAIDGQEGLWAASSTDYNVLVLDIMLPKMNGLAVLAELRRKGREVPVLLLTARDTVPDRVAGLRAGADDYLVKPFALEELLARVEALCRRGLRSSQPVVRIGVLELNPATRRVFVRGEELPLPPREFALLEYLARRCGEIVSRSEIETNLYEEQADPMSNVVDAAICALRRRLTQAGAGSLIHTRRGLGYILEEGGEAES